MAGGAFADGAALKGAHLYEYKTTIYFIPFWEYERKRRPLHKTDCCKYDNQILALFTSSLYLGPFKGRSASILCGSISFFCGAVINACAMNIAMLIIGRLLLGVGIGFSNQAVPLYQSEMSPAKTRILVANLVNYGTEKIHPWGWRLSLGSAVIPAVLMSVGAILLPETPNSLVEQEKLEEGRKILEEVRGTTNVDAEFADLIDASNEAKAIKNPFRNLLRRKNRPQLIIGALGIPVFQQLTGMNSIYSSVVLGALLVGALTSMGLVDKFGRRTFFIEASIEMFSYMVALAVSLALKFGQEETLSKAISVFLVVIICLFCFAYGRSWGPLGWLVPSELFPLETRSAGQSIVVCVNMIFTALIAQCFLVSLCHLRYGIFLLFAALVAFMGSFIFFLLPETKQVRIEEVYLLFQNHWY
ncbi:hypothetical protein POPTR_009G048500v4 [Populus trichocarpa]|uniref:Uncharacterized protein n=1 Tax=Populus trichocarpa TaxID=3694 RepID=A0ACC0SGH6_POPTR|nr:hypothetical protein POPTR_009G048500v4 [Populus trichocarpa]